MRNRYAIVFAFALLMTGFYVSNASAYCVNPPGDLNAVDGTDVSDVQCSIITTLWSLAGSAKPYPMCIMAAWERADLNCDMNVDVTDTLLVIQTALGQSFNPIIDDDGNGCPDTCGACGDDVCDGAGGEDCASCTFDCGGCSGSCCTLHLGKGCNQPFIQSCVCGIDTFCCELLWDEGCAAMASAECGATCPEGCGDGFCDTPTEDCANCAADCGVCAENCGDNLCDDLVAEDCVSCAADCGSCPGSCCEPHNTYGCSDATVQTCVCDDDPYCCILAWDPACSNRALDQCSAVCTDVCKDGVCTAGESCESCPEDCGLCDCANGVCDYEEGETCGNCEVDCGACIGSCCLSNGSPGCEDKATQDCVCAAYPTCCNVMWSNICALRGSELCGVDCGNNTCGDGICNSAPPEAPDDGTPFESCTSCPTDCGACPPPCGNGTCSEDENCSDCIEDCGACTGDCNAANTTPGCVDQTCNDCVCDNDPYCCNTEWDATCALYAVNTCNASATECTTAE